MQNEAIFSTFYLASNGIKRHIAYKICNKMGNYAVKMQLDFVLFALQNKVAHTLPCTVNLGLYGPHRKV